jgi:uncharacterized delta-60 repeat protein
MILTRWLRSAFAPRPSRKSPPALRLALERLEDRTTPSSGGLLDPTFGSGGVVSSSFSGYSDYALDVLVQPDGKVVAAGSTNTGGRTGVDFLVARYNPNGTLDGGFGMGGRAITDFKSNDHARAVALQPGTGGKILAAGSTSSDFALARYNANGTLDTSFGKRGITLTDMAGQDADLGNAIAVQPDGKIVVAGLANTAPNGAVAHYFALARYTANGALDTTFGSGGKVITSIRTVMVGNSDSHNAALALQGDGKIVLAGGTYVPGGFGDFVVARFNPNGTPDTAFGSSGRVFTDFAGGPDQATGVAIQADGKIVASGRGSPPQGPGWFAVARYNPDGALDAGFGQGGTVTTVVGSSGVTVNDVAVQSDGKILVGGSAVNGDQAHNMALVRYNADGSLDATYGAAGTGVAMTLIGTGADATALALQPDGKPILAGFSFANGVDSVALARYLPSAPQVGSFTADPNPVTAGASVTLTASNLTDANPGSTIAQVTFYYFDSSGNKVTLGTVTQGSAGAWSLTFTVSLPPGTYTLYAQAEDSYGVFGDPVPLTLQVM